MAEKNFNDKIQEAIDSQDYSELSNSIQNLVTEAVTSALDEFGDNVNNVADFLVGRKGIHIDRRPDYMKEKHHTVMPAQNPWMDEFDKMAADYLRGKDVSEDRLFSPGGYSRTKGLLFAIAGIGGLSGCFAGMLVFLILGIVMGIPFIPFEVFFGILAVLFGFMAKKGFGILSRLRRFKNYIKAIGKKCRISIRELAGANGKNEKETLKDIQEMIDDNMFVQGHLDRDQKNLYVTDTAFGIYEDELKDIAEKTLKSNLAAQSAKAEFDALPPEVQKILQDGSSYIDIFRTSNAAIQDPAVSEKLVGLEEMSAKIFDYVKDHPQAAAETRKLMKYYLPTTAKLLDSYRQLTEAEESGLHPDQIPNIQKSKKEIEETLDTLNIAFARLFDNLYQDTSMDISADISVLNTLLAQEGLVGTDIRSQEVREKEGQVLQTY